jgi:hypothetical protein
VLITPVTFWGGDGTTVSPGDQHKLADYFYQSIQQQLARKFTVAQEPGPGVMTVQVTLIGLAALALAFAATVANAKDTLPSWNEGPAKKVIVQFVRNTTDKTSAKFVRPEAALA